MPKALYHGYPNIIKKSIFGTSKRYDDCDLGFYCTDSLEMVKE